MITTRSADGADVCAHDDGKGPVVLVVGPGMDDGSGWRKVATRLAGRFRVVRLRRRRYRLDLPADPVSVSQEVADVLAVAQVAGEPVLVVGHSSGGVVALEAMVAAPTTFAGAVLYEPAVLTSPAEWRAAVERAKAAVAAGKPGRAMAVFLHDVIRLPPWAARLSGWYAAAHPTWRAFTPRQVDDADAIDHLGVRLAAYARITTPTVLLGGARSPAHLGERIDALARAMPRAEKVNLPGQGHSANRTAPAAVARVVADLADRVLR